MWDLTTFEALTTLKTFELFLLSGIVFLAGIVRGYTGFGLSAVVITSASLFLSPLKLVPILYLLEVAASVYMFRPTYRDVDRMMLLFLLLGCALGMPVGQYLLISLPVDGTKILLYSIVIVVALLVRSGYEFPYQINRKVSFVVGIATGLASGLAAVGGLVTMVVLLGIRFDVVRARATLVAMFFVLYIFGTLISVANGLATQGTLYTTMFLLLPLFIGVTIGQRSFLRTPKEKFRQYILRFLIILAGAGAVKIGLASGR